MNLVGTKTSKHREGLLRTRAEDHWFTAKLISYLQAEPDGEGEGEDDDEEGHTCEQPLTHAGSPALHTFFFLKPPKKSDIQPF